MHRNSEFHAAHSADHTARNNLQPINHALAHYFHREYKMQVYVDDIFAILLNHATKFKEVKIREKVSPVLVSNGRREK